MFVEDEEVKGDQGILSNFPGLFSKEEPNKDTINQR